MGFNTRHNENLLKGYNIHLKYNNRIIYSKLISNLI